MAMSMDPHVLLLDVELDDVAAESNVRRIRRQAPDVKIVVLTMHDDGVLERQLRAAGPSDYLTKDASAPILLAAFTMLHSTKSGRDVYPPAQCRATFRARAPSPAA